MQIYEKLNENLEKAKDLILASIKSKMPIIIRHHADADGYCAAIAIERAVLKHLRAHHRRESDIYYHYKRLPLRTPFYDIEDGAKDITSILSDNIRHEHKLPLILILDTGSSQDDIPTLKLLKAYKIQVIVIDHHPLNPENKTFTDLLINPMEFDQSYSLSAGMICSELAKMLHPSLEGNEILAAVAGVADKIKGEAIERHIQNSSLEISRIEKIGRCLNYLAFNLGYTESRYLVDDLLNPSSESHNQLIDLFSSEIERSEAQSLLSLKKYIKVIEKKKIVLAMIDYGKIGYPGEFPSSSRLTSLAHEYEKSQTGKHVISLGFSERMATIRISDGPTITFWEILEKLKKEMPYANIQGGGHKRAGSLSFIPAAGEEVLDRIVKAITGWDHA